MFERQYRDYRSGIAKERFNKDLADLKAKANAPIVVTRPVVEMPKFSVDEYVAKYPKATPVQVPVKGQLLWQVDVDDASRAGLVRHGGDRLRRGRPHRCRGGQAGRQRREERNHRLRPVRNR